MRKSTAYLAIPVSLAILGGADPIATPAAMAQPVTESELDRIRRGNQMRRYVEALIRNLRYFREQRQCGIWLQLMSEFEYFGDPSTDDRQRLLEFFPPRFLDSWAETFREEMDRGCQPIPLVDDGGDDETIYYQTSYEAYYDQSLGLTPIEDRWRAAVRAVAEALADCDQARAERARDRLRRLVAEFRRRQLLRDTAETRRRYEAARGTLGFVEERLGQCFAPPEGVLPPSEDGDDENDGDASGEADGEGTPEESGTEGSPDEGDAPDTPDAPDTGPDDSDGDISDGGAFDHIVNNPRLRDRWMINEPEFFFGLRTGEVDFDGNQNGIGFFRDGAPGEAPETFAGEAPDTIWFFSGEISIETTFGKLFGGYREGDARRAFTISPGASNSGIVYGDLSPGGSSGIATPFGVSGDIEVDFSEIEIGGEIDVFDNRDADGGLSIGAGFSFSSSERTYTGSASGSGSVGGPVLEFSQMRTQELDENYFRIYGHAEAALPAGPFIIYPNGCIGLYYRDSRLHSVENNMNNFSAAVDRNFTIEIERDDDGVGFQSGVGISIGLPISERVLLQAGGEVEYRSDVGAIFNTNSGDQVFFDGRTSDVTADESVAWILRIGTRIRFR